MQDCTIYGENRNCLFNQINIVGYVLVCPGEEIVTSVCILVACTNVISHFTESQELTVLQCSLKSMKLYLKLFITKVSI